MSGKVAHAEGWRRHLNVGFCDETFDPLTEALDDKDVVWLATPQQHPGS